MTTIPLSMREGNGRTLSGDDAPLAASQADDDGKLDALIDSVADTIATRGAPNGERDEILLDELSDDGSDSWRDLKAKHDDAEAATERGPASGLDRALKAAVDRRAGQEAESADFHQSRQWRAELERRYDGREAIGGLLDMFADWHERLKQNPRAAADAIASAYLEQPPHAVSHEDAPPRSAGSDARAENANADQKLNGILDAAIDRHHGKGDGEQQAFVASARHRAALKEMFPGMSYAEACCRVVKLDGDLHRDPIATAARLAATYGMTVTPSQQAVAAHHEAASSDAQQIVVSAAEHLPELAEMEDELVEVLGRPDFMHGPDMHHNLLRAHRVVQLARDEQRWRNVHQDARRSAAISTT